MGERTKKNRETAVIVIGVLAVIVLGGGSAFYLGRTLVSPWAVLAATLPAGFALAVAIRRVVSRLLGSASRLFAIIYGGVVCAAALTFVFLCVNYSAAREDSHTETVTVERLYSRTRHRSRRVGRRYTYTGDEYKVYYMEVSFADGRRKEIYLGEHGYGRRRRGDTLRFAMRRGLMGLPVITSYQPVD